MTSNQKKEARSKNNFEKARKRAPGSNVLTNFCNLGRPSDPKAKVEISLNSDFDPRVFKKHIPTFGLVFINPH